VANTTPGLEGRPEGDPDDPPGTDVPAAEAEPPRPGAAGAPPEPPPGDATAARGAPPGEWRPPSWTVSPGTRNVTPPDRLHLYGYPSARSAHSVEPRVEARRRSSWFGALVAGVAGALLTLGIVGLTGGFDDAALPATTTAVATTSSPPDTVVQIREIITEGDDSAVAKAVATKVVPSVVTVEVGDAASPGDFTPFASGSGVVLTSDGLIATNHHVIEDANETRVIFQNGRIYQATIVGSDSLTDLAVLKISADDLVPISLGSTEDLAIGDRAIAVGNPLGLRGGASLTVGVVSAFDREVDVGFGDVLVGMLQTDAPITQGSSGGALVDGQGRLIGITAAIGVSDAGAEGIGFAIPVELVERITSEIIESGAVHHAFLGVSLADSFATLDDGSVMPDGALITDYAGEGFAAEEGGLQPGDIVVRYDEFSVETRDDLIIGIRQYRVGDTVELEVRRSGTSVIVAVVLGERPTDL
jgi:S1-C subfamily serine protease